MHELYVTGSNNRKKSRATFWMAVESHHILGHIMQKEIHHITGPNYNTSNLFTVQVHLHKPKGLLTKDQNKEVNQTDIKWREGRELLCLPSVL